jgi:hypothetical protein
MNSTKCLRILCVAMIMFSCIKLATAPRQYWSLIDCAITLTMMCIALVIYMHPETLTDEKVFMKEFGFDTTEIMTSEDHLVQNGLNAIKMELRKQTQDINQALQSLDGQIFAINDRLCQLDDDWQL